jgi:hypothetical protein
MPEVRTEPDAALEQERKGNRALLPELRRGGDEEEECLKD